MSHNHALTISDSGDMSTATLTSDWVSLEDVDKFSLTAVYTGAPVGTLKLQGSNDAPPTGTGAAISITNTFDVTDSSSAITASGNTVWNAPDVPYRWVRVHYTKTSGTGTLAARVTIKGPRR